MEKVRFCLVGTGRAGMVHAGNILQRVRKAELVSLVDTNHQSLENGGKALGIRNLYSDYKEALSRDDADAAIIVTPTFTHQEIACFAAENKKHVFLEKPMALSVVECDRINDAIKKNDLKLQLGFMRRFDAAFIRAKEILDSGEMGRVMIIKSTGRGPGLPPVWALDTSRSNGMLSEVNSHDIDSLRWFTESDFNQVFAIAGNYRCPEAKLEFPDFYDNVSLISSFQNGMQGFIGGAVSV